MDELRKLLEPYASQHSEVSIRKPKKRRKMHESNTDAAFLNQFGVNDTLNGLTEEGGNEPLPGFDYKTACEICKIKCNRNTMTLKEGSEGATLVEFLDVAQAMFNQQEGRPALDIANDVLQNLKHYAKKHPEKLRGLLKLDAQAVHRHFKYNHERKAVRKIREEVLQVLLSMMDVAMTSSCYKDESGRLSLSKQEANLLLNIIDRIQRVYTLKQDNT